jgi:hypothetical protein
MPLFICSNVIVNVRSSYGGILVLFFVFNATLIQLIVSTLRRICGIFVIFVYSPITYIDISLLLSLRLYYVIYRVRVT